ncbi:hypothetical protein DFH94DRAFT_196679 [Russula ochroleuca]|uniref:Uncharacterized protein n=1 Tax=Russula ochroleuca TaxID=152965 RepID=A0A9P5JZR1_9AGAM|nr:hypothetical protein DFH94DRAFT_196679 [Russula ochroleuca]
MMAPPAAKHHSLSRPDPSLCKEPMMHSNRRSSARAENSRLSHGFACNRALPRSISLFSTTGGKKPPRQPAGPPVTVSDEGTLKCHAQQGAQRKGVRHLRRRRSYPAHRHVCLDFSPPASLFPSNPPRWHISKFDALRRVLVGWKLHRNGGRPYAHRSTDNYFFSSTVYHPAIPHNTAVPTALGRIRMSYPLYRNQGIGTEQGQIWAIRRCSFDSH